MSFVQQCFHFLHLGDESRRDGLVEIVRGFQPGQEALGWFVVRIVLRLQDDADGFFRILPTSFFNAGLGQAHDGFGKTVYRAGPEFADIGGIGESIDGRFVLGVSRLVVALHEGDRTALHSLRSIVFGQLHALGDLELGLCFDSAKRGLAATGAGPCGHGRAAQ